MRCSTAKKRAQASVKIRRYKPADHEACRGILAELALWHRHIYEDASIGGSDPGRHFDSHIREYGANDIWVAEVDGKIVGMAGMIVGEEGTEIEPLVVSIKHRGKGIGAQLVNVIVQTARQRGESILSVRPVARNDPAIRFFRDLGFDTLGHVQLFMDLTPVEKQKWKGRKTMAGRIFRY